MFGKRILALDPGVKVGWAVYDGTTARVGVETWLGFPTLAGILADAGPVDLVAIEEPMVGPRSACIPVHETAKLYGYLRGRLEASGIEVVSVTAPEWRKELTGSRSADNAQIKAALLTLGLLPKKSCDHSRDALGLAWFVANRSEASRKSA